MAYYQTSASGTIWYKWSSTTATTCDYGTDDGTWATWTTCSSSATAEVSTVVLKSWTVASDSPRVTVKQESKAERKKREAEERRLAEEARVLAEKNAAEKAKAEEVARKLLREHLFPDQLKDFDKDKAFIVQSKSGRRYRIKLGWAGNIEELNDEHKPVNRFCIHPREMVPHHDNVLAQKLVIENDEELFLKTANRTPIGCN